MLRHVMPVVIGLVYVGLNSLVPEPHRRRLNALVVGGAGAAYVSHHRRGTPIIPSLHDSSFGCALCDPVIALWCFAGGLSIKDVYHRLRRREAGR